MFDADYDHDPERRTQAMISASLKEAMSKVHRLEELRRRDALDTNGLRDRVVRAESERNDARAEVAKLQARQQELLATIAKISQTTPFPDELAGWEGQRAKMIAEVGTLRSEVARLNGVVEGMEQGAAVLRRDLERATAQRDHFDQLINMPGTEDFLAAVKLEAAHQIERWGVAHDAGKRAEDWVALMVHLLGKATRAHYDGNTQKLKHHIITSAAVALNWHRALTGVSTLMRPGVGPREDGKIIAELLEVPKCTCPERGTGDWMGSHDRCCPYRAPSEVP